MGGGVICMLQRLQFDCPTRFSFAGRLFSSLSREHFIFLVNVILVFFTYSPFYGEEFQCEIPIKFRFLSFYICDKNNNREKVGTAQLKHLDSRT